MPKDTKTITVEICKSGHAQVHIEEEWSEEFIADHKKLNTAKEFLQFEVSRDNKIIAFCDLCEYAGADLGELISAVLSARKVA